MQRRTIITSIPAILLALLLPTYTTHVVECFAITTSNTKINNNNAFRMVSSFSSVNEAVVGSPADSKESDIIMEKDVQNKVSDYVVVNEEEKMAMIMDVLGDNGMMLVDYATDSDSTKDKPKADPILLLQAKEKMLEEQMKIIDASLKELSSAAVAPTTKTTDSMFESPFVLKRIKPTKQQQTPQIPTSFVTTTEEATKNGFQDSMRESPFMLNRIKPSKKPPQSQGIIPVVIDAAVLATSSSSSSATDSMREIPFMLNRIKSAKILNQQEKGSIPVQQMDTKNKVTDATTSKITAPASAAVVSTATTKNTNRTTNTSTIAIIKKQGGKYVETDKIVIKRS